MVHPAAVACTSCPWSVLAGQGERRGLPRRRVKIGKPSKRDRLRVLRPMPLPAAAAGPLVPLAVAPPPGISQGPARLPDLVAFPSYPGLVPAPVVPLLHLLPEASRPPLLLLPPPLLSPPPPTPSFFYKARLPHREFACWCSFHTACTSSHFSPSASHTAHRRPCCGAPVAAHVLRPGFPRDASWRCVP